MKNLNDKLLYKKKYFSKHTNDVLKMLSVVSQIGLIMVSCVLIGFFVGVYIEKYFPMKKIIILFFILLGIIAGFYKVYKTAIEILEKK